MINYIDKIAKVDKNDRFNGIVQILEKNKIQYYFQKDNNTTNIIVSFNKDKNEKILVIGAHYDNALGTPGANDNAAACVILLNLIQKLKDTKKRIDFVFFDKEECGMYGSFMYVNKTGKNKIEALINLDMCGLGNHIIIANYPCDSDVFNLDIYDKLINDSSVIKLRQLPQSDYVNFVSCGIPSILVIASTEKDVMWYTDYSNNKYSKVLPDFGRTMHQPSDTIESIGTWAMINILKYLYNHLKDF